MNKRTEMIIKIGNLTFTVKDENKQQKIIDVVCDQDNIYPTRAPEYVEPYTKEVSR